MPQNQKKNTLYMCFFNFFKKNKGNTHLASNK